MDPLTVTCSHTEQLAHLGPGDEAADLLARRHGACTPVHLSTTIKVHAVSARSVLCQEVNTSAALRLELHLGAHTPVWPVPGPVW